MKRPATLAAISLIGTGAAFAEMSIDEAHYEAGVLVVRGKAAPNAEVAIDGRYKKTAEADGTFVFHLNYKPDKCRVLITAGEDNETRDVSNCTAPGATPLDDRVPPGTTIDPQKKP